MNLLAILLLVSTAFAGEPPIRGEVDCNAQPGIEKSRALVIKAVDAFKKNRESLLKELNKETSAEESKWPGLFAYEGTKVIAHEHNPSLIGRDLAGVRDVDGVTYVESFVRLTTEKGDGCITYRFPNPANGGRVEPRTAFVLRGDGKVFLGALK